MINIGQLLKDDSFYAGHHPVYKNRFLLCKDRDEPEEMTWDDANSIDGPFKLPTLNESAVLFAYRCALGFGVAYAWYWTSKELLDHSAWQRNLDSGNQIWTDKSTISHIRLVRTVTQEELEALV